MANVKVLDSYRREGLIANSALSAGDLVYQLSTGKWAKAQADAQDKHATYVCTRDVSSADATAGGARAMFSGAKFCTVDGFSSLTHGAMAYLSPTTAGAATTTKPATAGQVLQSVGYAISATVVEIDLRGAKRPLSIQAAGNSNANLT